MKTTIFLAVLTAMTFQGNTQLTSYSLPLGYISSTISVDHNGHKWIPTGGMGIGMGMGMGIHEYDGSVFTLHDISSSGLSNNDVYCALADGAGNIWIGTTNYLDKYDGTSWTGFNTGASDAFLNSMDEDNAGNIWSSAGWNWNIWTTYTGGLWKFNSGFTHYLPSTSGLPVYCDNIISIDIDAGNNIWGAVMLGGLLKFDGTTWTHYNQASSGLPGDNVIAVDDDMFGNIWVATHAASTGIAKFDGTTWTVYDETNSPISAGPNDVMCVNNKVFVAGLAGTFYIFDVVSNTWQSYDPTNSVLQYNDSLNLAYDSLSNTVWLSSGQDRIYSYDLTLGLSEQKNNFSIDVYPNPARSTVNIHVQNMKGLIRVEMVNTKGQIVLSTNENNNSLKTDVSGIPSGVYFLNLTDEYGNIAKQKFMRE